MNGTLKVWRTESGYGFLTPDDGGRDIFVHISSFQKAGLPTPHVGERFAYAEGEGKNGKTQAVFLEAI